MTKKQVVEIFSNANMKFLNKYKPAFAISEYIWNGFDANSKQITPQPTHQPLNVK